MGNIDIWIGLGLAAVLGGGAGYCFRSKRHALGLCFLIAISLAVVYIAVNLSVGSLSR